jgi:predicted DNA-binding transcriptional regulator YafY
MTATHRFRRLLLALPHFHDQRAASLTDVATLLGVEREVLLSDLQALAERYDEPAGFLGGIGVLVDGDTVTVRAGRFRRPMRLSADELCALELGLMILARERAVTERAVLEQLQHRLADLIADLPRDRDVGGRRDGALGDGRDGAALDILRQGLRAGRSVHLHYQGAGQGEATERVIHPRRLTFARGGWYLAAWCEQSAGPRVFRVDRIIAAAVREDPVREPDPDTEHTVLDDGTPFVTSAEPSTLVVRYSPAIARWIAERDGLGLEADGAAIRTHPLADREWAIRHVLQYGPDATIVEPAELREAVVERLQAVNGLSP